MEKAVRTRRGKRSREPRYEEVSLGNWGPRGSTCVELDGARALVDRGLPGEIVRARFDTRRRPWRGVVEDVVRASPHRAHPPCPYYLADCGGCQLQHVDYSAQLEAKRCAVDRELAAAGVEVRVSAVHAMRYPWRYRHTAAIAIGWEAGFRPRGRRGIVEIHDCLIAHPLIGELADSLNSLLRSGCLPNYHGKVWLECTVVDSQDRQALQVIIQGAEGLTLDTHPELAEVARVLAAVDVVESVAFRHRSGRPVPLSGDLCGWIDVGGDRMQLPAGSFSQTNREMLDTLMDRLKDIIRTRPVSRAADVYGGAGTFALALAPEVEEMILVELDVEAVEAARRTASERQVSNVRFLALHAERALAELPPLDLMVVDPPRCGLGEVVVKAIGDAAPPRLLYVSCAPASMATDIAALQSAGYRPRLVEVFDFYPQTYHVESLVLLDL